MFQWTFELQYMASGAARTRTICHFKYLHPHGIIDMYTHCLSGCCRTRWGSTRQWGTLRQGYDKQILKAR